VISGDATGSSSFLSFRNRIGVWRRGALAERLDVLVNQ
jgi:hypothetical protein